MEKNFRRVNNLSDDLMGSMSKIFSSSYMEESIKRMSESYKVFEATEAKLGENDVKTRIAENNFVDSGLRYLGELKKAVVAETNKQVEEIAEMDNLKLAQLGRAGLFDTTQLTKLKRALAKNNEKLTVAEKGMLVGLLDTLINQVLGNQQVFAKVKQNLASEEVVNEEVEQIDELSKATLGSYVKKAVNDVASNSSKAAFSFSPRLFDRMIKKNKKRKAGIDKVINKLSKEEVEQIDELSSGTLRSYVDKAHGDAERTHKSKQLGKPNTAQNKRIGKRLNGMNRALGRLTREEAEEIEESRAPGTVVYTSGKGTKVVRAKIDGFFNVELPNGKVLKDIAYYDSDDDFFWGKGHDRGGQKAFDSHKEIGDYYEKFPNAPKQAKVKYDKYGNVKEEAEQIDELSSNTLRSYSSKAKKDINDRTYVMGNASDTLNMLKKLPKAGETTKNTAKSVENLIKQYGKKTDNRRKGLETVRDRLKEEKLTLSKIKEIIGKPSKIVTEEEETGNNTDKLFSEE